MLRKKSRLLPPRAAPVPAGVPPVAPARAPPPRPPCPACAAASNKLMGSSPAPVAAAGAAALPPVAGGGDTGPRACLGDAWGSLRALSGIPCLGVSLRVLQKILRHVYSQKVLDRTVGVKVCSAHSCINIGPGEAHAFHVGDCSIAFGAHGQRGGIIEAPGVGRLLGWSGGRRAGHVLGEGR